MKIVIDMNLSVEWVDYLRTRGHEAWHWSQIGPNDSEDDYIVAHCLELGAIVLSGDLDFATYHALAGSSKPSVIQLRGRDLLPLAIGPLVVRSLTIGSEQLSRGAVVTIKSGRMRITRLPIASMETL